MLPKSVTSIGTSAFGGTKWLADKRRNNPYVIINGMLVSEGALCSGDIVTPQDASIICGSAFIYSSAITSVEVSDTVTDIGESAFSQCDYLESVKIPDSVKNIGETPETKFLFGDANCDASVNLADGVLIMQAKANTSIYVLSDMGLLNGDCCDTGDGIQIKTLLQYSSSSSALSRPSLL